MNIVAQNHQSRELLSSKISNFLEEFHVGRILKACSLPLLLVKSNRLPMRNAAMYLSSMILFLAGHARKR